MFPLLEEAVENLEAPRVGDELATLLRLVDRLNAKVSSFVGAFDRDEQWGIEGATSMAAWLRHRAAMSGGAAAALSRTARRLSDLPATAAAWQSGALSGGQVQAMLASVDDATAPLLAEHEAGLVPTLVGLSVRDTAVVMGEWRQRADALVDRPDPDAPARSLHHSTTLDGRGELTGSLDADSNAVVGAALRLATSDDADGESRTQSERRADALVEVCQFFLDHQKTKIGGRHRPHLNVVVDFAEVLSGEGARTLDGVLLTPERVRTLLCDSAVHRVITDGRSTILDYGRATRVVSAALFTALALRDQHCRHPRCDRPPQWCEAHHVVPWETGGETNLENLVLKCSRHHHLGHLPGWLEKLRPDGTLEISDPSGQTWTTAPPGALLRAIAAKLAA